MSDPCGCWAFYSKVDDKIKIEYCPLHKAAPELLKALKILHPQWSRWRTPIDEEAAIIERIMDKAEKEGK